MRKPGGSTLLVVDMLNYFRSEGDESYRDRFDQTARSIGALKRDLADLGVRSVYANTTYESTERYLGTAAASKRMPLLLRGSLEARIVELLEPLEDDLVIQKTVNSAFFDTELDKVLRSLSVGTLILTGVHTHVCVLLTAADAFYRGYNVLVPWECVTTMNLTRHQFGLEFIDRHLGRTLAASEVKRHLMGQE